MDKIQKIAPEVYEILQKEEKRQQEVLDLIPSENYASKSVLEAASNVFTNKYAEGYPGQRYYPGCQYIDELETLCQKKAKQVFNLKDDWEVNVQPLSGGPANFTVYFGLLQLQDKILSMQLSHGGHLSHGHKVNISSKIYQIIHYGVDDNGYIDYDNLREIALREKPKLIISGATAYPRIIDFKKFGEIAKEVGAFHLADISHIAGLISAGLHPSPFDYSDVVMTTTHKTLRGPRSAVIFFKRELANQINKAVFPGIQGGGHHHIVCAKAVSFYEALKPEFKEYQNQIIKNAKALAEELKKKGFKLLTDGTDNHLMLINLRDVIDASTAENLLEQANILANRNTIPGDDSPFKPTGIRLGTPAVATRGMREKEMEIIADWFFRLLISKENPKIIKTEVIRFCKKFPIPQ
ncbi:MAG: serine hydroxymethyltransferase [Candidatus Paceibacterota bacterium]|jgi:glycine hydroxymethyltransferase